MKAILIAMTCAVACAVDPTTATSEQDLICGQYCDPTDIDQIIADAARYGESLFYDAVATGVQYCSTTSDGQDVCSAVFQTCQIYCVGGARCCQYIAQCTATQCGWYR